MALTADAAIDALGGTGAVSAALNLPASTISTWRARGIPPRRWSDFVRLAADKGCTEITFEALAEIVPREPLEPVEPAEARI
jgi:hypothetical protein